MAWCCNRFLSEFANSPPYRRPEQPLSDPLAYWSGQLVPSAQARLEVHDAGFVLGATVTDLCRTVRHQLYRWPDHVARFRQSCRLADIELPRSDEELTASAVELVAHNTRLLSPEQDLALVVFATPGLIGYYGGYDGGPGDAPPTLAMHTFPLPFARYRRLFREGAHLVIPDVEAVSDGCVDPRIKQRSRLHWWLADRAARRVDPHASALLLDPAGEVTETAAANFLLVCQGAVFTPPRQRVLNGISLRVVEELCAALRIRFEERDLKREDCLKADEAMLSSTPYCLAGVSRIDDAPIPWPGPVFGRLLRAWSQQIGLDIQEQIERPSIA
jgi:branched-chain amino acid aminotransferase